MISVFKEDLIHILKMGTVMILPGGKKLFQMLNISTSKATEIDFFYQVVMDSLRQRKLSKTRRNDLIDLMMDAAKGDMNEEEVNDQFEQDAKLK